jgi:hypothetical protein
MKTIVKQIEEISENCNEEIYGFINPHEIEKFLDELYILELSNLHNTLKRVDD